MYKLIILIPISVDMTDFDEGWPDFLAQAESMPGLIKESVTEIDHCLYGQNFLRRIYEFYFQDQSTYQQAMISPQGEKAGGILHRITGGNLILLSGQSKEDSLDHIQSLSSS
jgi:hypothetical protein